MAKLNATPKIVMVRLGESSEQGAFTYEKDFGEEVWFRKDFGDWQHLEEADDKTTGGFGFSLHPGQFYQAAIYVGGAGPNIDPQLLAEIKIFAVRQQPQKLNLVTGQSEETGGTFHTQQIITGNEQTAIAAIGMKRGAFSIDDQTNLPVFDGLEGGDAVGNEPYSNVHGFTIMPLVPGHQYELKAVIVDKLGNWEIFTSNPITHGRKLTIQFTKMFINNDSDGGGDGEASFTFSILYGAGPGFHGSLAKWDVPKMAITTGHFYNLGQAYIGSDFVKVEDNQQIVSVRSVGTEDDGPFNSDEGAGLIPHVLSMPAGNDEEVLNRELTFECEPNTDGSDFRYTVFVTWSVEYAALP